MQRISATSVMVVHDDMEKDIRAISEFRQNLDIGLHFVLTGAAPLSSMENIRTLVTPEGNFPKAKEVIKRAYLRKIKKKEVLNEFKLQYQRFVEQFGFKPDFIDSHHNVHQFPIINNVVIEFLEQQKIENRPYIRNTAMSLRELAGNGNSMLKQLLISLPGRTLKKKAQKSKIPTNNSYSGIYDLANPDNFEKLFVNFLENIGPANGIISIHPGFSDKILSQRDIFGKGREKEYCFLVDNCFPEILRKKGVFLGKYERTVSSAM